MYFVLLWDIDYLYCLKPQYKVGFKIHPKAGSKGLMKAFPWCIYFPTPSIKLHVIQKGNSQKKRLTCRYSRRKGMQIEFQNVPSVK